MPWAVRTSGRSKLTYQHSNSPRAEKNFQTEYQSSGRRSWSAVAPEVELPTQAERLDHLAEDRVAVRTEAVHRGGVRTVGEGQEVALAERPNLAARGVRQGREIDHRDWDLLAEGPTRAAVRQALGHREIDPQMDHLGADHLGAAGT